MLIVLSWVFRYNAFYYMTFTNKQDIEIAALFAALLAWGQRPTIISKCNELLRRMDDAPYQFITQHQDEDGAERHPGER